MVKVNKLAISCAGLLATAVAGAQFAAADPSGGSYEPGATYTIKGQAPSSDVNVAVLPSASYFNVSGKANENGEFTFPIPTSLGSGEYTVLTSKGGQAYEENSTFSIESSKRRVRSHEHEHEHEHSDHSEPQQTYGGMPVYGMPYGGGFGGSYGKESITAIAANGAGSGASAQIGLVSLAGFLGALALF